jgi:hypothetical protein
MQVKRKGLPEIYFHDQKGYYYKLPDGSWSCLSKSDIKDKLKNAGFSPVCQQSDPLSEIDFTLLKIREEHHINDVISLAGLNEGIHRINNQQVLVTDSPILIPTIKGDYTLIDRLCSEMLGEHQKQHFYSWMQISIRNLREKDFASRGQGIFLVGEKNTCKSLLQKIITYCLGGRSAIPSQYLLGQTQFNAELFSSEHLIISDSEGQEFDERENFSIRFKGIIANDTHYRHAKGFTPNSYAPKWRVTVSLNDDAKSMKIIPILDDGMADKINIYKVSKPDLSDAIPMDVIRNDKALDDVFKNQVPAFLHFLINDFEIDQKILSTRFGITAFHNPTVLAQISMPPMLQILKETLESGLGLDRNANAGYFGKATDFFEFFKNCGTNLDTSFNSTRTFGRRLTELTELKKSIVTLKNSSQGSNTYLITTSANLLDVQLDISDINNELRDAELTQNRFFNSHSFRQRFIKKYITPGI